MRISRNDWLTAGFDVLAAEGTAGLTIESLTRKLNVTKGSFYHHFQNVEDYKNALLAFWEQEYTIRIVTMSDAAGGPAEVFTRFLAILASESPTVEISLRAWAFQDAQVQAYVQRIDETRVAHARRWFEQSGHTAQQAERLSRMLNALLIGCYTIFPPVLGETLQETIFHFLHITGTIQEQA
ncbi:MAG: TetR/AcrR family transcriptional regulator [Chloroflexota bacterium]